MKNRKEVREIVHKCYDEAVREVCPNKQDVSADKKVNGLIMLQIYGATLNNIVQFLDKASCFFSCSRNEKILLNGVISQLANTSGKINLAQLNEIVEFITKGLKIIEKEDKQVNLKSRLFGIDCFMRSYLFSYLIKKIFPSITNIYKQRYKEMGYEKQESKIQALQAEFNILSNKLKQLELEKEDFIEKEEEYQEFIQAKLNKEIEKSTVSQNKV